MVFGKRFGNMAAKIKKETIKRKKKEEEF